MYPKRPRIRLSDTEKRKLKRHRKKTKLWIIKKIHRREFQVTCCTINIKFYNRPGFNLVFGSGVRDSEPRPTSLVSPDLFKVPPSSTVNRRDRTSRPLSNKKLLQLFRDPCSRQPDNPFNVPFLKCETSVRLDRSLRKKNRWTNTTTTSIVYWI